MKHRDPDDERTEASAPARGLRGAAIVTGLLALAYLLPLGVRPLFLEDELRYAEVPREMLASGDWVVPRLLGLRYFEKPPLGYWSTALSIAALGEKPLAVRLPATLATFLTALVCYALLRRRGGGTRAGLLAALILLSTGMVAGIGTFAVLDAQLALFLTAVFAAYYAALHGAGRRARAGYLLAVGVCAGAAFLVKGFLALAVPVLVIVPFMLWEGRWRDLLRSVPIPLASAAAVALPWALLVQRAEPDFWHYFFWVEHVRRFAGDNAQHTEAPWFYLVLLPGLIFPWIFLAPAGVRGLRDAAAGEGDGRRSLRRYLVLWTVLPFLFFSASRGKLATYILPCCPPFAMLLALGLEHELALRRETWMRAGARAAALVLAALVAGLLVVQLLGLEVRPYRGAAGQWIAVALGVAAGAALLWTAGTRRAAGRAPLLCGAAVVPVLLVMPWMTPTEKLLDMEPRSFLARHAEELAPRVTLAVDARLAHAVGWYCGRTDAYVLAWGELEYGATRPDSVHRDVSGGRLHAFLDENLGERPLTLLARQEIEGQFADRMPAGATRSAYGPYVLWHVPVHLTRGAAARDAAGVGASR